MMSLILIIAIPFCLFGSAVCLLVAFALLPWARDRYGDWSLALFPASTFVGAYLGWSVMWAVFS